jgi:predicted amino acid-binding ACT domain protein
MRELHVERKTAIETVHFSGHTPIYIETEPEVKDLPARETMDSLLKNADGFISIHYLSEGLRQPDILRNYTPIEYELIHFLELHKGEKVPILLFRQIPDRFVSPSKTMIPWFDEQACKLGINIIQFSGQKELGDKLWEALRRYEQKSDVIDVKTRYIVRYSGSDYIGLIAKVTEIIFTYYKLNIDYISQAARGGLTTLYASCSPRGLPDTPMEIDRKKLKKNLKEAIEKDLQLSITENRLVDGADPRKIIDIQVDEDTTKLKPFQFYVELRTIDAPGQLNAICRVLSDPDHRFNIDELEQKPTPTEYKRQSSICLWLSKPAWSLEASESLESEIEKELRGLEFEIQSLVGVRAFTIKVVKYK